MNQFAKRGRGILLLLLGMLVFGSFAGCDMNGDGGSGDAPLVGTVWNRLYDDGSADNTFMYFTEEKWYYCKKKKGTYWSGIDGKKKIYDYTLSGNKLTVNATTSTISVSGDIMTAITGSNTEKYKKVTSPSAAEVMAGAANTTRPK